MSIATIGGLLLILGAWFTMRGSVFKAVGVYFVADVAWVWLAFDSGDIQGAIFVFVGMTLGLIAWLKMNFGKMRKTLEW